MNCQGIEGVSSPRHLLSIEELEQNGIVLGPLEDISYDAYVEKMNRVARDAGITAPLLGAGAKYSSTKMRGVLEETLNVDEDTLFDLKTFVDQGEPRACMFVVDSSKFRLPI